MKSFKRRTNLILTAALLSTLLIPIGVHADPGPSGSISPNYDGNLGKPSTSKYDEQGPFSDGLARVVKGGKYGYIDKAGKVVIPLTYTRAAENFVAGWVAVSKIVNGEEKWGYINKNNQTVIPFTFDGAESFGNGLAVVIILNGTADNLGFIDKTGKLVIPAIFSQVQADFTSDSSSAIVTYKGRSAVINRVGKFIVPAEYNLATRFSEEGLAGVKTMDGTVGFINEDGAIAIPFNYSAFVYDNNVRVFSNGLAGVLSGTRWGYIDSKGTWVIPPIYYGIKAFNNGVALVVLKSVEFRINTKGQYLDANNKVSSSQAAKAAALIDILVFHGSNLINFPVNPFIEAGTTMVAFRAIFEELGLEVTWDSTTKTVTGQKEGLVIKLVIGSNVATVNGVQKTLLQVPKIVDGSTFVPLRFIGEASGKDVTWDGSKHTVNISE